MIAGAFGLYHESIAAPGFFSLLPVLGSVLLILASDNAIINRTLLSWKSMIFIGLISYSLYLWHWPLISYLHIITPAAPQWHYGVALLLAFPISILIYIFIENPIRRTKSPKIAIILIISIALCIALGQTLKRFKFHNERTIDKIVSTLLDDATFLKGTETHTINGIRIRTYPNETEFPEILFIGDSHIEQYNSRIKVMSNQTRKHIAFLSHHSCLASVGFYIGSGDNSLCKQLSVDIKNILQDPRIKTVVIGQIWGQYQRKNQKQFEQGIEVYLNLFKQHPDKKFFVLLDYPWDNSTYDPARFVNRLKPGEFMNNDIIVDYPTETLWKKGNNYIEKAFTSYATIIETESHICPNKKCNLHKYMDDDHLRSSYVEQNAVWIDQAFN